MVLFETEMALFAPRQIASLCTLLSVCSEEIQTRIKDFVLEEDGALFGEACELLTTTPILRPPPKSSLPHLMNNEGLAFPSEV
uniref:Uncharacterized protein n=1 Tax=Parascaris univalens TaxID=6257 RepID=A0A915BQ76_PARUN